MLRRVAILAGLTLLCLGALLLVRPLQRPVLATLDEAAPLPQISAAPYLRRAFYGRRLEPYDGILHGGGQTDRASFDRYAVATGTNPMLWMTYLDLRDDLPAAFDRMRADLGHFDAPDRQTLPQIGLALNRGDARLHYEAETAAGRDDAAIAQLCMGLQTLRRPAFVRVGYEFNGPWNGYRPEGYRAAFQHIAAALHTCSPQIAVVWNWSADAELDAEAAGYSADTLNTRLQEFYPGDSAVDWWALNLFTPQGIAAPATKAFLQAAALSKHPVLIGESSPKGVGTVRTDARTLWFAPYFNLLRATPGIKAFCYIDWNWTAYPQWADWGDARLEQSPALLDWYRRQLRAIGLHNALAPSLTARILVPR